VNRIALLRVATALSKERFASGTRPKTYTTSWNDPSVPIPEGRHSVVQRRFRLFTRGDRIHFTRGVRHEMFEPEHAIHAHPSFKVRFEHQLKTAMDRSFESALYSGMTPFGSVSLVG